MMGSNLVIEGKRTVKVSLSLSKTRRTVKAEKFQQKGALNPANTNGLLALFSSRNKNPYPLSPFLTFSPERDW